MIVISSAELRNNMKKYLDFANTDTVVIQRGKTETFVLSAQVSIPDVDLSRAITKDELLTGIKSDIRDMYANGKQ
jgi:transcription antitermination factor NusA-like protein